jgi:hypothetical protein
VPSPRTNTYGYLARKSQLIEKGEDGTEVWYVEDYEDGTRVHLIKHPDGTETRKRLRGRPQGTSNGL